MFSCTDDVTLAPVEDVKLNYTELDLYFCDKIQLVAEVFPSDADTTLVWTSTGDGVYVDEKGAVYAAYSGWEDFMAGKNLVCSENIVTATSANGEVAVECKVKAWPRWSLGVSKDGFGCTPIFQMQQQSGVYVLRDVELEASQEYLLHLLVDNFASYWFGGPDDLQYRRAAQNDGFQVATSGKYNVFLTEDYRFGCFKSDTVLTLSEGDTYDLSWLLFKDVSWHSDNEAVATVTNGVVKADTSGEAEITVLSKDGSCIATWQIKVMSDEVLLPANCFVASSPGEYRFYPFMGNSLEAVGEVFAVEVLWESWTEGVITEGSLIENVTYKDGLICFVIPEDYKEGNAVIAAKGADGDILWSWHIWLTDKPKEDTYYVAESDMAWDSPSFTEEIAGVMMDRNLGATSADPGDINAHGLLYQWGRKDPFLNSVMLSTIEWPSSVQSDRNTGTINYTVSNPTVLLEGNQGNDDWFYHPTAGETDHSRWGEVKTVKTIYDPCPRGWRVPNTDIWEGLNFEFGNIEEADGGISFFIGPTVKSWYPYGDYWTTTEWGVGKATYFGSYWNGSNLGGDDRAASNSVRCIKF